MLQLTQLSVSGIIGTVNMTYTYSSTQNNGKIISQTDAISGETVQYTYDSLNRLATAQATSNAWGQSYAYDGFGNLTDQNVIAGSAPEYHTAFDPSTNHPTAQYGSVDANGNTYVSGATYDASNRLAVSLGNFQYSYDPGNKRVWRGVWTSGTLTTDEVTFWSVSGQKLATYQMNVTQNVNPPVMYASQTGTDYYFGGKLIKNAGGYVGADRLGSIGHFYPYGQEKPSATQNGTEKFTGYFRDTETSLDYADQRYHNQGTGRFLTPDPSSGNSDPKDPGSWNSYVYASGDPANEVDPSGTTAIVNPSTGGVVFCYSLIDGYDSEGLPLISETCATGSLGSNKKTNVSQFPECNPSGNSVIDTDILFILQNYSAASAIAVNNNVNVNWVLGWAAAESGGVNSGGFGTGWGTGPAVAVNNNYLGETKDPSSMIGSWSGNIACPTNAVQKYACFSSFFDSVSAAFDSSYGEIIRGMVAANSSVSAQDVFSAVGTHWDPGNNAYGQNAARTIKTLSALAGCLMNAGYL